MAEDHAPQREMDWRPALYVLAGFAALLLIASFTGTGTGMFGWGFMMGSMWVWMLFVIIALVFVGYFIGQQNRRAD